MAKLTRWFLFSLMAALLTGCSIGRATPTGGDIDASFAPPAAAQSVATPTAPEPARAAGVATTNTVVRLQPTAQQLNVGDLGNLQIWVDNVTNLFGVEIAVQFDPRYIQVQDADPATDGVQIQPGTFPAPNFVQAKLADNTAGLISYVVSQTSPTLPVTGSGVIATFTFKAVAQGVSNLTFITVKLADPNGQAIQTTAQAGQVTVGQGSGEPTATFTATPLPGQSTATFTPTPLPTFTPTPLKLTPTPTFTPVPPPPTITPVSPVTTIPQGATIGFCYRVQEGETLTSIAQKFGLSPRYLNLVNDLNPPGYVFTYQALFIPTEAGQGPNVYIVQAGDTLTAIADACHLPVSFLAFANKLNENAVVQAGHVLEIPIPPFAPPSRYPYPPPGPPAVFPPPNCGACGSSW